LYFDIDEPKPIDEFFAFFWERDETVIMTNSENSPRAKTPFPAYIPIDTALGLFPCASLVGWRHQRAEIDFLRKLHESSPTEISYGTTTRQAISARSRTQPRASSTAPRGGLFRRVDEEPNVARDEQ
jgi:hypothetical protein